MRGSQRWSSMSQSRRLTRRTEVGGSARILKNFLRRDWSRRILREETAHSILRISCGVFQVAPKIVRSAKACMRSSFLTLEVQMLWNITEPYSRVGRAKVGQNLCTDGEVRDC